MATDDGDAIGYQVLRRGTVVRAAGGERIGTVRRVLDNAREHIFDGIVIETSTGDHRFVDAPEVARTAERGVTLRISSQEAAALPAPEKGPSVFKPRGGGKLSRFLGGGWKKD